MVYFFCLSVFFNEILLEKILIIGTGRQACTYNMVRRSNAWPSILTKFCHQNKINKCDVSDSSWHELLAASDGARDDGERGGRRNINNSFLSRIYKTQI